MDENLHNKIVFANSGYLELHLIIFWQKSNDYETLTNYDTAAVILIYGWMTCNLTPFLTISVISGQWEGENESCEQWNHVYDWKDFHLQHVPNRGPLNKQASA